MRLLFNDRLAPITSTIGFLQLPLDRVVAGYLAWQRGIHEPLGRTVTERPVSGSLDEVLCSLLPLVSNIRSRELFVPTASRWTAFFDNGWRGTDAFAPISYMAEHMRCRGMRVVAVPDTMGRGSSDPRARYGGLILEVYGPKPNPILNHIRTISLVNDGGRWDFDQSGEPFPFEDSARYEARRKTDRFTFEMLESYLGQLGLRPFEESFYLPSGASARLIEKQGARPPDSREYSLAEARGESEG